MVLPITFSEKGRNGLGIISTVLSILLSFLGLCLIIVGIYIQVRINDQLLLLKDYNDGLLPNFLISVGTLMLILNTITAKFAYDTGFAETSDKFRLALMPLLVIMALITVVIFSASMTTFGHKGSVEDALHGGLMSAMKRYKKNFHVKLAIDRLQMTSRCCGSKSFKDWFEVSWVSSKFVEASNLEEGGVKNKNVPFSCCDVRQLRPCVTDDVLNFVNRKSYNKVTLYKKGCTEVLLEEFEHDILEPVGSFVFVLFCMQSALIILLRYLQTSVQHAIEEGDPEASSKGHVIPNCLEPCQTGDAEKYAKMGALDRSRGERSKKDKDKGKQQDDTTEAQYGEEDEIEAGDDDTGGGADAGGGAIPGGLPGKGDDKKKKDKKKKDKKKKDKKKKKKPKRRKPLKRKKPKKKKRKKKKKKKGKQKKKGGGGKR